MSPAARRRKTGQAEACPAEGVWHVPAVGQASACPASPFTFYFAFATKLTSYENVIVSFSAFVTVAG